MSFVRWALGILLSLALGAPLAHSECLTPPGDLDASGTSDVVDVQCILVVVVWDLGGQVEPVPACLGVTLEGADTDCNESLNVADVQTVISYALGQPLSAVIDADGTNCPDSCELGPECVLDADCFDGDGCTTDLCEDGECTATLLSTCAGPQVLFSEITTSPTSSVPSLGGDLFDAFDRPYMSPTGSWWGITASTDAALSEDEVLLIGRGVDLLVVAREGDLIEWEEGAEIGALETRFGILDDGRAAFATNLTDGDSAIDELIATADAFGNPLDYLIRESEPVLGVEGATYGTAIELGGWLTNGLIAARLTSVDGLPTANDALCTAGPVIIAQEGITVPTNQAGGGTEAWQTFDSQDFRVSADGSTTLIQGDLAGTTTIDDIVVVNGAVVVQEDLPLPGFAESVSAINEAFLSVDGSWMVRGSNDGGQDWVVLDGAVVASSASPIVPGSTELFDDGITPSTFFSMTANGRGDYIVGGTTNAADADFDAVLVLNGTTVVARQGDPVDLDGNGLFDDDLFLDVFNNDDLILTDDRRLIFTATLRDGTGMSLQQAVFALAVYETPVECTGDSDCNDTNPCTTDACDAESGACVYAPTECDDGDGCTTDKCSLGAGGCVFEAFIVDVVCGDANACTTDACDPAVGCTNAPIPGCCGNSLCEDSETCASCSADCGVCTGDCCAEHPGLGCETSDCQGCVCGADPSCCELAWDLECGAIAAGVCLAACPDCDLCGNGVCDAVENCTSCAADCGACTGDCCKDDDDPGCEDATCQGCVCAVDVTCCTTAWDSDCVDVSIDSCGGACPCGGLAPPTAVMSEIEGSPTSAVPGLDGVSFTSFDDLRRSPNGQYWILTADTDAPTPSDEVLIAGTGFTPTLAAREGDEVPWSAGETLGALETTATINSAGDFAFGSNTSGSVNSDEYLIRGNIGGGPLSIGVVEGAPVPAISGALQGDALSLGDILEDGSLFYESDNLDGVPTAEDAAMILGDSPVAQKGITVPLGLAGDSAATWQGFDLNDADTDGFGGNWFVQGDTDASTGDDILVVNGIVVLQEDEPVGGTGDTLDVIEFTVMDELGNWLTYANFNGGQDFAMLNGEILARTGEPIVPGAEELWDDVTNSDTFICVGLDGLGNYIVIGESDNPDTALDEFIVLNGKTVVLRSGDPVDIDQDGLVDDAFVVSFSDDECLFFPNGDIFAAVMLENGSGTNLGEAIIAVSANTSCTSDADCDDSNPCTTEACDIDSSTCEVELLLCDDGDPCTTDFCNAASGGCEALPFEPEFGCNDNNPCTVDTCDSAAGCVHSPIPDCCGNSSCDADETCVNCSADCGDCTGDCCSDSGLLGCETLGCQDCVCAVDSTCCETAWDTECAALSGGLCVDACEACDLCGNALCDSTESCASCPADCGVCIGDCCKDDDTPGCEVDACQECVCGLDVTCCTVAWDAPCADAAETVCAGPCPCGSSTPPTVVVSAVSGATTATVTGLMGVQFQNGTTTFDDIRRSPNGEFWIVTADTDISDVDADEVLLVGSGVTYSVAAKQGDSAPWAPGEVIGAIDTVAVINDKGEFAFSTNTDGGDTTADEVIVFGGGLGAPLTAAHIEGQPIPALPEATWGSAFGVLDILDDGTLFFESDTIGGLDTSEHNALFLAGELIAQQGVTVPTPQAAGALEPWGSFDFADGDTDGFGTHWFAQGDLNGDTSVDDVLVVDGTIVLQEDQLFAPELTAMDNVEFTVMDEQGNWLTYINLVGGQDAALLNGSVVAKTGDPIVPGSTEVWDDAGEVDTWMGVGLDGLGNYFLVGETNHPDDDKDEVLVVNGGAVVLRSGDAVDLDQDGILDDAFVEEFNLNEHQYFPSGVIFVDVELMNGAGIGIGEAIVAIGL